MTYNKKQIMKRAWEIRKTNNVSFSDALAESWSEAKNIEFPKMHRIKIDYKETALRKRAKKNGWKWNPDMKLWEKVIKYSNINPVLQDRIVESNKESNNKIQGPGFYYTDTPKNRAIVNKYGFDAIEMVN